MIPEGPITSKGRSVTCSNHRFWYFIAKQPVSVPHMPPHWDMYCNPCRPLLRAVSGWVVSPPPAAPTTESSATNHDTARLSSGEAYSKNICQQKIPRIWVLLVIFKHLLRTRKGAPHHTSVPVGLGSPILRARALFRSRVDGCVPQTQHVNSIIASQPTRPKAELDARGTSAWNHPTTTLHSQLHKQPR
jgi:hypothetical protein